MQPAVERIRDGLAEGAARSRLWLGMPQALFYIRHAWKGALDAALSAHTVIDESQIVCQVAFDAVDLPDVLDQAPRQGLIVHEFMEFSLHMRPATDGGRSFRTIQAVTRIGIGNDVSAITRQKCFGMSTLTGLGALENRGLLTAVNTDPPGSRMAQARSEELHRGTVEVDIASSPHLADECLINGLHGGGDSGDMSQQR